MIPLDLPRAIITNVEKNQQGKKAFHSTMTPHFYSFMNASVLCEYQSIQSFVHNEILWVMTKQ
jgi:hypothetical protein